MISYDHDKARYGGRGARQGGTGMASDAAGLPYVVNAFKQTVFSFLKHTLSSHCAAYYIK